MKRIIVIGCPGSGKTTLAIKLGEKTGLPLYHLDAIWHRADRTNISRADFDARLAEILSRDEWIIDGNYSRTLELRLLACDTVILFDLPLEVCLDGVISRIGKKRCDMPWIETELDPEFRAQIEQFRDKELPSVYELIERHGEGKSIVIFKSRAEADEFIRQIS